jgi:hypothetical protein
MENVREQPVSAEKQVQIVVLGHSKDEVCVRG